MKPNLRNAPFALLLSLSAVASVSPAAWAGENPSHVTLAGKNYDVPADSYVIGNDHQLYHVMSPIADGNVMLQKVAVGEWNATSMPAVAESAAAAHPADFIAEVEMKDCAEFCEGNRVFHSGGAETAKVDRVFSGGSMTAVHNNVLVMTTATEVVREDSFLHHERGVAGVGGNKR